jgi:hypothetical protein
MTRTLSIALEALAFLASCAASFLIAWIIQGSRLRHAEEEIAKMQREHSAAIVAKAIQIRQSHADIREIKNDAQQKLIDLYRTNADVAGQSDRLRVQLEAAKRRAGERVAAAASAPAGCPPADATAGVLPDMLGACSAALVPVGGFADRSRIAGLACEQSYAALKAACDSR